MIDGRASMFSGSDSCLLLHGARPFSCPKEVFRRKGVFGKMGGRRGGERGEPMNEIVWQKFKMSKKQGQTEIREEGKQREWRGNERRWNVRRGALVACIVS